MMFAYCVPTLRVMRTVYSPPPFNRKGGGVPSLSHFVYNSRSMFNSKKLYNVLCFTLIAFILLLI